MSILTSRETAKFQKWPDVAVLAICVIRLYICMLTLPELYAVLV